MGSLQQLLPHRVDANTEEAFLRILRQKVTGAVSAYVDLMRAVEAECGPEAVVRIRERLARAVLARAAEAGARAADRGLRAYCADLEAGCLGSHDWEKLEDTDTRQAYRFTRCIWADAYRALGAEDMGLWGCNLDGPAAAAFNPDIKFSRSKTLMAGDECCDHVYYVEPRQS